LNVKVLLFAYLKPSLKGKPRFKKRMRLLYTVLLAWFVLPICSVTGQETIRPFKVLNYDQLKPYLSEDNDTTYVVNFWATWCVPCVGELPYFQNLERQMEGKPFRLLLVSLDFRK